MGAKKSISEQVAKTTKKTAEKAVKTPQTDMFTLLCSTEFNTRCVKEYIFHPTRKWRFDYALPSYRIALEVEGGVWSGGRHTSPKGFLGDMEKYNTATLMGWKVLRTTPDALMTEQTLTTIRHAIDNTFPFYFAKKSKKR